jgi:hypothetical protein
MHNHILPNNYMLLFYINHNVKSKIYAHLLRKKVKYT